MIIPYILMEMESAWLEDINVKNLKPRYQIVCFQVPGSLFDMNQKHFEQIL